MLRIFLSVFSDDSGCWIQGAAAREFEDEFYTSGKGIIKDAMTILNRFRLRFSINSICCNICKQRIFSLINCRLVTAQHITRHVYMGIFTCNTLACRNKGMMTLGVNVIPLHLNPKTGELKRTRICGYCGIIQFVGQIMDKFKLCSRCRRQYYCSRQCQYMASLQHKQKCKLVIEVYYPPTAFWINVKQDKSVRVCATCGDLQVPGEVPIFKQCGQCHGAHYCSVKCQRKDWRTHKLACH